MQAGRLDRRIVIENFTEAQDAAGQEIKTWATFATVWAERRDVRGTERNQSAQKLATRTAIFRIRWLVDMTEEMRLIEAGTTYGIIGIADSQRKGWMELTAEAINPEAIS